MVELIMTILLIGILSATAIPRMNLINGFDEAGYRDQIIAALQFARKAAVAQRRNVQVTLADNSLSFDVASDIPEGSAAATFDRNLNLPGAGENQISPRGNTTLTGPASLIFAPLGSATAPTYVYTVSGESAVTVTVDAQTGYVH
jgi:MSHA pilin protein MshC